MRASLAHSYFSCLFAQSNCEPQFIPIRERAEIGIKTEPPVGLDCDLDPEQERAAAAIELVESHVCAAA